MRITRIVTATVLAAITAIAVVACGGGPPPEPAAPVDVDRPVEVSARANIFGAGHDVPPGPGGGGPGVLPPAWVLPAGQGRLLTFPAVTGSVNPIRNEADFVSAAGDSGRFGTTDVTSYGGISGIIHRKNGMFLVGVFLTDAAPTDPAPARLDYTDRAPGSMPSPEIGQTFLIGDGRAGPFAVPDAATRLFVGFADGYLYQGKPGWYDNNVGALSVSIAVAAK